VVPAPASSPAPPPFTPQLAPLKLKEPAKKARVRPEPAVDIYGPPVVTTPVEQPGNFPWKLAAAVVVLAAGAIVGGKLYMPAKGATPEETETPAASSPAASPARSTAAAVPAPDAGATGRLEIETQPAGARILIDGKPVGESPVAVDGVAVGRHTITAVSASGSLKRTVRIEAGRTAKLDLPIFSGWVGIYAPFVVEVSEGGRVIGTTEEPRLMLSPGRHDLTLVNRELGYKSTQSVEIEPGEVRSISLDPRGAVNLNASPWAEVWIEGRKAGDTPIANLQLPLGTREVTFRHPQFGDRRVVVTVKGTAAAAVSVDMTKPGS
jgi:PEGA domain